MSLEYALEQFPLSVTLKKDEPFIIRPLHKRDAAKLQKFFLAIPEEERLFLKKPVTDRSLFQEWCRDLDYNRDLPLLMLRKDQIVGEVTLHQRGGGWKRHIGAITTLTHPDYRGLSVTKTLVDEMTLVARHLGLKRLEIEITGERKVAIRALEQLGFRQLLKLPDYVMDMKRQTHDYVLLGLELGTDEEYTSAG